MAYCSKEAHSCVEKAAMIGFVKMRILEPDETCSLRGHTVREVMVHPVIDFSKVRTEFDTYMLKTYSLVLHIFKRKIAGNGS